MGSVFSLLDDHRITGLFRLEKVSKGRGPTFDQTPLQQLDWGAKCHIQSLLTRFQEQLLHNLPGQPVLMPNHSFCLEIPPNLSLFLLSPFSSDGLVLPF